MIVWFWSCVRCRYLRRVLGGGLLGNGGEVIWNILRRFSSILLGREEGNGMLDGGSGLFKDRNMGENVDLLGD